MDVMILAAGKGERMRPLTNTTPKPLLKVGQYSLIEHHIHAMKKYNFKQLIINTCYLADSIEEKLGDGSQYDLKIRYSREPNEPLGTAGGIVNAQELFSDSDEILILNSDIYTNIDYSKLKLPGNSLAHLILVDNPEHHPKGDFCLVDGFICKANQNTPGTLTFSGIGVYRKTIFDNLPPGKLELIDIYNKLIEQRRLTGQYSDAMWIDVGNPDRLEQARKLAESK